MSLTRTSGFSVAAPPEARSDPRRHYARAPALAEYARVEWRRVGFLAGTEPANRYGVPVHLKRFTRLHVRIEWRDRSGRPADVAGPCILGGGRFYGLDLLAA